MNLASRSYNGEWVLISFSHGWTSNRQKEDIRSLSLRILANLINVRLRIDIVAYRGLHQITSTWIISSNVISTYNYHSNVFSKLSLYASSLFFNGKINFLMFSSRGDSILTFILVGENSRSSIKLIHCTHHMGTSCAYFELPLMNTEYIRRVKLLVLC